MNRPKTSEDQAETEAASKKDRENHARRLFQELDHRGTASLTRLEIAELAERLGIKLVDNDELDGAMNLMDSDESGSVDVNEFVNWYHLMMRGDDYDEA
eukprot:SAG31_NODE_3335_length_4393_cov_1.361202_2_plen_98_part_01